jgi:cytochrome c oxidase subunit 3
MSTNDAYYIPHKAVWPIMATAGLMLMLAGFANYLNGSSIGSGMMIVGFLAFLIMLGLWFALQSTESEAGMYNHGVGISYRMGMMWFIFSEVMFFAVFFGALEDSVDQAFMIDARGFAIASSRYVHAPCGMQKSGVNKNCPL